MKGATLIFFVSVSVTILAWICYIIYKMVYRYKKNHPKRKPTLEEAVLKMKRKQRRKKMKDDIKLFFSKVQKCVSYVFAKYKKYSPIIVFVILYIAATCVFVNWICIVELVESIYDFRIDVYRILIKKAHVFFTYIPTFAGIPSIIVYLITKK